MVKRLTPAFSRSNSYLQVLLNLVLTDKLVKATGAEAGVKGYILSRGFTRYNALYFNLL
jgi:hypothetical protein